jgi:nitrogen fixation NifU-like protein
VSGLEDLYREIILDHYRSPRNRGELETPPAHRTEGFNPLCGDEIVVYVEMDDGEGSTRRIIDIKTSGQGCSISQSSASMMSAAVKGKTVAEVRELTDLFKSMMSIHEAGLEGDDGDLSGSSTARSTTGELKLGDLEALRGVVKFPVRIKCATLSWNTLIQALDEVVTAQHSS